MAQKAIKASVGSEKSTRSHRNPLKSKKLLTNVKRKPARVAHAGKGGLAKEANEELRLPKRLDAKSRSRTAQIERA